MTFGKVKAYLNYKVALIALALSYAGIAHAQEPQKPQPFCTSSVVMEAQLDNMGFSMFMRGISQGTPVYFDFWTNLQHNKLVVLTYSVEDSAKEEHPVCLVAGLNNVDIYEPTFRKIFRKLAGMSV
jgi:hypothetical protein